MIYRSLHPILGTILLATLAICSGSTNDTQHVNLVNAQEYLISFESAEKVYDKFFEIFESHGLQIDQCLKKENYFKRFVSITEGYKPNSQKCHICGKTFKKDQFLHLHFVRKHFLYQDQSMGFVGFGEVIDFLDLLKEENEDLNIKKFTHMHQCMNFISENFNLPNIDTVSKICEDFLYKTQEVSQESILQVIYQWVVLILLIIFSLVFLVYIIEGYLAESEPLFMKLAD